jgi:hypothetical protein
MLADAGPAPVAVARLMATPLLEPEAHVANALAPLLLPALADHRRVGWQSDPAPHVRGLPVAAPGLGRN